MKFTLPHFVIVVRELTDDERAANRKYDTEGRDYFAVDIRRKHAHEGLTMAVGSPVIMTRGKTWDEKAAARTALSFAAVPSCHDTPADQRWSRTWGEELVTEAFGHRILGTELREGC